MNKTKKFFQYGNIGYLFVLPALIYMIVMIGYPTISNIILSFQDVTVRTINSPAKPLVGFTNYISAFHDPKLKKAIFNTFTFTIGSLIFQFIIGFALALFFKKDFTLNKPIRGLMMMPWMIPLTITALMFKFMFSSSIGIVNQGLIAIGLIHSPISWLLSPSTAMTSIIIANIWIGIPFNMILLLTGLTSIPEDYYESASIDGANKIHKFFGITLPLLRPAIESVLVLGFIYTFKVFDLVLVMTGGGPVDSTQVLSTYSYKQSFNLFQYSKGATTANILFLILFVVGIFYLKYVYTDEEV